MNLQQMNQLSRIGDQIRRLKDAGKEYDHLEKEKAEIISKDIETESAEEHPVEEKVKPDDPSEEIRLALAKLSGDHHYRSDGKPRVESVSSLLGYEVTRAEIEASQA